MFNRKKKDNIERKLHVISESSPFAYVEAYKSLRTNLKFASMSNDLKKIAVTSAIPGEGKSNVVINLAVSLAQEGNKVLVVDCDLRKPIMHKYLKIRIKNKGVTTVLSGESTLNDSIVNFRDIGISVLCAGLIPPNPAEILASTKMKELIDELSEKYDYVLFDTPPVSVVTDAAVLSRYVDGVVLVVRQGHVTIETAKIAMKNLQAVNAPVIGAIMNDFDTKTVGKASGYYYSYEYDYSK